MKNIKLNIIVILILAVVAAVAYSSSINSSFHFDDVNNIADNADVKITDLSYGSLKKAALTNVAGLRPVSYLSFALNYYFGGLNTTPYHVVNVIIHVVNAFLIYLIILALFSTAGLDEAQEKRLKVSAFFTALIWLAHPLNSQSVIYIVQRMVLLMSMFFLLAFLSYTKWRRDKRVGYLIMTGVFFALSLLSKQNAAVFPAVIILYELVFIRKGSLKNITRGEKIFAGVITMLVALTFFLFRGELVDSILEGYKVSGFSMYERVLTQFRVLVDYIVTLILPLTSRLCVTHSVVKSTSLLTPITTFLSLIVLLAMLFAAISRMKKSPYLSFAILWFFILLSVESTIIPLMMKFDHRMYMPSIFLIGVAVDFVVRQYYTKSGYAVIIALCVISLTFSAITYKRGFVWQSESSLWKDVVAKYPNEENGLYQLDLSLKLARIHRKLKQYALAEQKYRQALIDNAENGKEYNKILEELGTLYVEGGRYNDADKVYSQLLARAPGSGRLHYNYARLLGFVKKYGAALKEYDLATQNGFKEPQVLVEAIKLHLLTGNFRAAKESYRNGITHVNDSCISDFIDGMLAEHKGSPDAKKHYSDYLSCQREQTRNSPYTSEASERLKRL